MAKRLSIIVPVLHEADIINDLISHLGNLESVKKSELIIVDGSATGDTILAVMDKTVRCLSSPPGRARQMNTGAAAAFGDILLFLHADTYLPPDALSLIDQCMAASPYIGGAFNLSIRSHQLSYRLIASVASLRSRITRIPYGDQAIFIDRKIFQRLGGYPEIPIMEDVALMRRIKKEGSIAIIPRCVVTSPRRWKQEGILFTTIRNWSLLMAYYLGVSPKKLALYYEQGEKHHDQ